MNSFLLAIQLLTIISINHSFVASDKQVGYSCLFYPFIGFLIGGLLYVISLLLVSISIEIQAALILIFWVMLTGGLHLDGLADCADAWVGGLGSKRRSLEIMKDPVSGPVAVTVLVLVLLLKWTLVCYLLEQEYIILLVLTPMLGRVAIVLLMLSLNYIREGGIAETMANYFPRPMASILSLCFLLVGFYYLGFLAIFFMMSLLLIIRYQAKKRIGGVTGDVYGAAVELVEIGVLLGAVI